MLAALTMLFIDRNYGGVFFDAGEGGAPLLYEHLAWFFFTGAYMLIVIVAAGVISDVLPTFARKPLFSHRGAMLSLLAIAVLGPLAWMQNMYTAPIPLGFEIFAMLFALALTVPIGLLIFNWVATLWGGTLHLRAAPLFALGAISSMAIGLAGELTYSVIPVGWQLNNTTAAHGDTFAVLAGGAVLGGFAALHYWFPKLTGRLMGEGMGKAALAAILAGIYVYVLATFLAGLKGQPVDVYKFFEGNGLDGFNLVASIAAFVLAIGVLLQLANVAHSWGHGVRAGHDPWGGATLEWFALSPPPEHNFDAVPDVRSAEPLDDIRRRSASGPRLAPPGRGDLPLSRTEAPGVSPFRRRPGSLSSMNRVAPRGEADELARFRRRLNATMLTTFALIVIGGVVRVSDSGLGCGPAGSGTEGWPLCGGRALPFLEQNALIEFSHRVAATIVAVLIAVLALQALRRLRDHRWLVRGSVAAALLVLAQAGLGGLTVEHGLHSALVAAHLGLAMLLLALLIALHRIARPADSSPPVDGSRALRVDRRGGDGAAVRDDRRGWLRRRDRGRGDAERAGARRSPRLRRAVPHLPGRVHALPVRAAGRHPPDPQAVHVPDRDRGRGDDRGGAPASAA